MAAEISIISNVFIARQPIFGTSRVVEGYELLFRSAAGDGFASADDDNATLDVICTSLMPIGLDKLAGTKRAWIKFTERLLQNDSALILPEDQVVIEVPNGLSTSAATVEACCRLKSKGYMLALDNFMFQPEFEPLLQIADCVKVDFQNLAVVDRAKVVQALKPRGITCLAMKIETFAECAEAEQLGYTLFQGYFFCKPSVLSARSLSASGLICLEAFREVSKPEIDFDRVADIVKRDVSFSYKLLRFVNSAALGLRTRIHSIKQALIILGRKESARWLSLVAMRGFGAGKPDELVLTCIVRARMAEQMAPHVGLKDRSSDAFLLGVFSAIDALVDRPVEEVVGELPLAEDVQAALMGQPGALRSLLEIILAYERGDWDVMVEPAHALHLDLSLLPKVYMDALSWANEFYPDLRET